MRALKKKHIEWTNDIDVLQYFLSPNATFLQVIGILGEIDRIWLVVLVFE